MKDGEVVSRWRDSAHHNMNRLMRLALDNSAAVLSAPAAARLCAHPTLQKGSL
jgi:hypothetical protein